MAPYPDLELKNRAKVTIIDKGMKILQNKCIFLLRKRLAPVSSILPNSLTHFIDILGNKYFSLISKLFSSRFCEKFVSLSMLICLLLFLIFFSFNS